VKITASIAAISTYLAAAVAGPKGTGSHVIDQDSGRGILGKPAPVRVPMIRWETTHAAPRSRQARSTIHQASSELAGARQAGCHR
jgi:hypothetical protein